MLDTNSLIKKRSKSIKKFFNDLGESIKKHRNEIIIALAIGCVLATIASLSVKVHRCREKECFSDEKRITRRK